MARSRTLENGLNARWSVAPDLSSHSVAQRVVYVIAPTLTRCIIVNKLRCTETTLKEKPLYVIFSVGSDVLLPDDA